MRLAIIASHPIQYHAPLFRTLARRFDLTVFYSHRATSEDQARAGFNVPFDWDVDLLSGYEYVFLHNVAKRPGLDRIAGCDIPEISERLARGCFDAVLVLGWHLKAYLQATFAAKRLGLPVIVRGDSQLETPRSVFKKVAKRLTYPAFLRLFNAALYVGARSYAYWTHYGYPTGRLFFSPHCVDTEWFHMRATLAARNALRARLGISPDSNVALFAGRLVPFKRPLDLVGAAARLKAKGHEVVVLVAGSGPLESEMTAAALEARLSFHALGFCNQTAMPGVYAAADVLVLPSSGQESWGLVANEAMACGRPVVLSNAVGAAPDLAGDGTAGRLFSVGDVTALARALQQVLEAPPTVKMIRAKSKIYSLATAVDGIEAALSMTVLPKKRAHRELPGQMTLDS